MTAQAAVAVIAGGLLIVSSNQLFGTTCIVGKSFKVRQVCGHVTDKSGAVIPRAKVQVTPKGHPQMTRDIETDSEGQFRFTDVPAGEYDLRVKVDGFWDAQQPFNVSRPLRNATCGHPIRVVMMLAGGCSYVDNARKK